MNQSSRCISTQLLRLSALSGWKRNGTLTLLGIVLTSAFAPVFFWPSAIIALTGLFLLVCHSSCAKRAFWDGWWFGLGHFASGLYWFAFALLTDAEQFAWLIPFAVLGIPSVLAFYIALVTFLMHFCFKTTLQRWLAFAFFWLVAEFLRATLFSGFPWNLLGYIWGVYDVTTQSASVVGVWGLSLLAALFCTTPTLLLTAEFRFKKTGLRIIFMGTGVLALMVGYGTIRLENAAIKSGENAPYIRMVQGNIAQHHKWDPARQMGIFRTYVELSKTPSEKPLSLIIWPESALPFIPEEQKWVSHVIADATPDGAHLITGALRIEHDGNYSTENFSIWNSLFAFNDIGNIVTFYDKHHLVPFGEYIPLRSIIPFKKITHGSKDFSEGSGPKTLEIPSIPSFSPLICYEVIFPDHVVSDETPPKWLLNVTNDAWFGISSGPYQHLHMARFRAVEEGAPLIRSANTGVSAVIDGYGRIVNQLALNQTGVLDFSLPETHLENTIYREHHGFIILLGVFFTVFWLCKTR